MSFGAILKRHRPLSKTATITRWVSRICTKIYRNRHFLCDTQFYTASSQRKQIIGHFGVKKMGTEVRIITPLKRGLFSCWFPFFSWQRHTYSKNSFERHYFLRSFILTVVFVCIFPKKNPRKTEAKAKNKKRRWFNYSLHQSGRNNLILGSNPSCLCVLIQWFLINCK